MTTTPHHPEVLISLAEEIRHTIIWLGDNDRPFAVSDVQSKINTLREAAQFANMDSIESILNRIDLKLNKLDVNDISNNSALIEETLWQLSSILSSIASLTEKHEFQWFESLQDAEDEIESASRDTTKYISLLHDQVLLLEACVAARNNNDRGLLLAKLDSEIRHLISLQRSQRNKLYKASSMLRNTSIQLSHDLNGLKTIPLDSFLFGIHHFFKQKDHNLNIDISCPEPYGLEINVRQIQPLTSLIKGMLSEVNHTSVGSIGISVEFVSGFFKIDIQGQGPHPAFTEEVFKHLQNDFDILRARLFCSSKSDENFCLSLYFPAWHNSLEVIPIDTSLGKIFVPLTFISSAFLDDNQVGDSTQIISLDRRQRLSSDQRATNSGISFSIGNWKAVLFGKINSSHFQATLSPPLQEDPDWVFAKVFDGNDFMKVFHPLPFMDLNNGMHRLYPHEKIYGAI
jgi:hypothetical protein